MALALRPILAAARTDHGRRIRGAWSGRTQQHQSTCRDASTSIGAGWHVAATAGQPRSMLIPAFASPHSYRQSRKVLPTARIKHHSRSYNVNRYERFRQCLLSASEELQSQPAAQSNDKTKLLDVGRSTFDVLATNRRTYNRIWTRMGPLLDLIVDCSVKSRGEMKSVADVGCDHGMLALSLAGMAWVAAQKGNVHAEQSGEEESNLIFSRVIGTDVSERALGDGGLASLERMTETLAPILQEGGNDMDGKPHSGSVPLPIEFRLGCGLDPLQPGEADAIVLAGLGVHTMLDILLSNEQLPPVERVQTQYLFLQPTNSRPKHMMILYERLQASGGWILQDERIAFVGGRWYISARFDRREGATALEPEKLFRFPGHFVAHHSVGGDAYDEYVNHHLQWLKEDYERPQCSLEDEDLRWLQFIISSDRWRSQAGWFAPQ
ncbi:hypothetical protein ACHAXT_005580 [Thalassiosira profunda]